MQWHTPTQSTLTEWTDRDTFKEIPGHFFLCIKDISWKGKKYKTEGMNWDEEGFIASLVNDQRQWIW